MGKFEDIKDIFTPSRAIRSIEHLKGRDEKLREVLSSLEIPGRSVFIYGDRGVGKTSLAQTAAFQFNSSKTDPVIVSCQPTSTFSRLLTQACRKLLAKHQIKSSRRQSTEVQVSVGAVQLLHTLEGGVDELPENLDVNDAVDLLNEIGARFPDDHRALVLIDEMDELPQTGSAVPSELAHMVKQLGDQDCPIKFIFAGITDNAASLLANHKSAFRYMATIHLDRLPIDVLRDIIMDGFKTLGWKCDETIALRIACISDGFAYFTHLIGFKLAEIVYKHGGVDPAANSNHYELAIKRATDDSDLELKTAYDNAVQKYKIQYEPVLWAAADHWETERSIDSMIESYNRICSDLKLTPQDRDGFTKILHALTKSAHGPALVNTRRGWYKFVRNMLRGYCRLRANSQGVVIGLDYLKTRTQTQRN